MVSLQNVRIFLSPVFDSKDLNSWLKRSVAVDVFGEKLRIVSHQIYGKTHLRSLARLSTVNSLAT